MTVSAIEFPSTREHFGFEISPQGRFRLFFRIWKTAEVKPRGSILGVHGYSEHGNRYSHFASYINSRGYDVIFVDLPGHGLSGGRRANVDDFHDYVDVAHLMLMEAFKREMVRPFHLFGHSLGGLIAIRFLQTSSLAKEIRSLSLSSPLLGLSRFSPGFLPALEILTWILPNLTLPNESELGEGVLTHDKEMEKNRAQDPLIKPQVTIHWVREFIRARRAAFENIHKLKMPLALFQAGDERVTNRAEAERFMSLVPSDRKKIKIYEKAFHEIINETNRVDVMRDIAEWLNSL